MEEDRDFTRCHGCVWLNDPTKQGSPGKTFRFRSVSFGTTSSPFILNATIQKHLKQFGNNETVRMLETDIYVDDILSGMKKEDLYINFMEASGLMAGAGFNLR